MPYFNALWSHNKLCSWHWYQNMSLCMLDTLPAISCLPSSYAFLPPHGLLPKSMLFGSTTHCSQLCPAPCCLTFLPQPWPSLLIPFLPTQWAWIWPVVSNRVDLPKPAGQCPAMLLAWHKQNHITKILSPSNVLVATVLLSQMVQSCSQQAEQQEWFVCSHLCCLLSSTYFWFQAPSAGLYTSSQSKLI